MKMFQRTKDRQWNPYLAGALAGLLAIGTAYATTRTMGRTVLFGASMTYVRAAAVAERAVWPERVAKNEYFRKLKPQMDWQAMLLCGLFFGALVSAVTGRGFEWEGVPPRWHDRFGPNVAKRIAGAFLGGVVVMFGARLAGGCPLGHSMSGVMQLSVSGLVATACFFLGASLVVKYLAKKGK